MDIEKNALFKTFKNSKYFLEEVLKDFTNNTVIKKSTKLSEDHRNEGNRLYAQKHHDAETHMKIFRCYCRSISFAPLNSEALAKAYGNRSAFLMHMHKHEECITDIDRALEIKKLDVSIIIKLLCRKVECMKRLSLSNFQCVLDEAENYARKVQSNVKARIDELINKAKACPIRNLKVSRDRSDKKIELPLLDPVLDCVSIEYNEKYGRHLIAKKDYNPGDLIFREDLYVTVLNQNMYHTNCNYCLKICWSGVPCDHCSWAMFCSEDCKKKACDAFHDVECSVVPYLTRSDILRFEDTNFAVALRLLVVGIREAGSIGQLKKDLKSVDQCTDNRRKGFYKNEKFSSCLFQSIYSLTSVKISDRLLPNLYMYATNALFALTLIMKHGELIENIMFDKIDDIIMNEDLIFLGSLMIKLPLIYANNGFAFAQKNMDSHGTSLINKLDDEFNDRGSSLAALASFMNHSCAPNVFRIFTEDRKINIFALKPIKKYSQIFDSYNAVFYMEHSVDRKIQLKQYNFTCECEACFNSWPPLLPAREIELSLGEGIFYYDCVDILHAVDDEKIDFSKDDIEKLCLTIAQAHMTLSEPSTVMAILQVSLMQIYTCVYGWDMPTSAFAQC